MSKNPPILLPMLERTLIAFGERLRCSRLRRNLTAQMVAERAGLSLPTLRQIEKGSATVSLGAYMQVMLVLNLEQDINLLAKDDELGRKLQDIGLPIRIRASLSKQINAYKKDNKQ